MNHASFTIIKKELIKELTNITKSLGKVSKHNRIAILELTITDDLLTIVIPGIKIEMKCETKGSAKATIGLYYFKDIFENSNGTTVECNITDDNIKIGGTTVSCQTTFFETDSILRSIKLPINYTDLHVLQLENNGYTIEELRFNELEFTLHTAKKNLKKNIRNSKVILDVYGFTAKEIENLIELKIKAR
jgi:hypothetical protein